jgi:predicted Zn-ribbon and HTH transcriptional regulator
MSLLDKLESKFGFLALPNLTVILIAGQTFFYLMALLGKAGPGEIMLVADRVMAGEYWRLLTFLFVPPMSNPFFAFFAWYLFYLMGSALESHWGDFRYNLFLLIAYLMTVAASFLVPYAAMSNSYIGGSVFLAFAFLFPDFEIMLFFILPIRIWWLALLTWLGYAYNIIFGSMSVRLMVLASITNFLLFFARDIITNLKYGRKKMERQVSNLPRSKAEPLHRCKACGIDDKSHPQEDFRYCPKCKEQSCYCQKHIFDHEHI